MYSSEAEYNKALLELKQVQCGRGVTVDFMKDGSYIHKDMSEVRKYRCAFYNHTRPRCSYRLRVIVRGSPPSSWEIMVTTDGHVDHEAAYVQNRGLKMSEKNLISPGAAGLTPHAAAVHVAKGGVKNGAARAITDEQKRVIVGFQKRVRMEQRHGGGVRKSTWGAVARALEKCTFRSTLLYVSLRASLWTYLPSHGASACIRVHPVQLDPDSPHTPHVIGVPLLDAARRRFVAVLSTEHLLLNLYRADKRGMGVQLMIDTEYRLVEEGYATMLIGVASLDQVFHVVAYAICSKEDTEAHEYCIRVVKEAVQCIVRNKCGGKYI